RARRQAARSATVDTTFAVDGKLVGSNEATVGCRDVSSRRGTLRIAVNTNAHEVPDLAHPVPGTSRAVKVLGIIHNERTPMYTTFDTISLDQLAAVSGGKFDWNEVNKSARSGAATGAVGGALSGAATGPEGIVPGLVLGGAGGYVTGTVNG